MSGFVTGFCYQRLCAVCIRNCDFVGERSRESQATLRSLLAGSDFVRAYLFVPGIMPAHAQKCLRPMNVW